MRFPNKKKLLDCRHKSEQDDEVILPSSAYIHIPFCRRRCYYCDFPISVLGDKVSGSTSGSIEQYIEVLCQEIKATPPLSSSLNTIFFGGGTPSLLTVRQLGRIVETLEDHFGIAHQAEISLEMDPGTFGLEQLKGYRETGVNRVSLGVQAFQDELLSLCGRSHNHTDILAAVELLYQVEIPDFSLDLMSGLPNQTIEQWQTSLSSAIDIRPTHISCYDLIVEPVTAFGRLYSPGRKPLPREEATAKMYRLGQEVLSSAGYEHYEISNYALPGHHCRHNRVYWENLPYYGFGMGAASYIEGQRFTRPRTRREYFTWVQQLIDANGALDCPKTSKADTLLETLMLGLRLADGLNLFSLKERFGEAALKQIFISLKPYYNKGWVEIVNVTSEAIEFLETDLLPLDSRLRLTDPEGFLFSNQVLADLFNQLPEE
ncbi:MAG: radical SAM family heme chaperone HemW [Coleofasciculaceae cyanobacterium]